MVLIRARGLCAPLFLSACFGAPIAMAQELPTAVSVLDLPEDELRPTRINLAGASVTLGGVATAEYDDNIYAQAFSETDDFKMILQPFVDIRYSAGALEMSSRIEGNFRRFLQNSTENANGGQVQSKVAWAPTATDRLVLLSGYLHGIEDRGEPEASTDTRIGPRQFDNLNADLSYSHQGSRIGFSVRGTADTFRFSRAIDQTRDLDSYAVIGRVNYRVGALADAFVEGFVNKRDFAPTFGEGGLDRDSNTYGGRIGVAIDPGGTLRGEAAVGVYHFDPSDGRLDKRTGFSAQASMIFQPTSRTAFTLDAFSGNVATYQIGASSRDDTRVRLGVQQELRRNLRGQASAIYRRTKYFGTGLTQNIFGGLVELEYIVNRRVIVAGTVRYTNRDSSAPLDSYARLRIGISLKLQY